MTRDMRHTKQNHINKTISNQKGGCIPLVHLPDVSLPQDAHLMGLEAPAVMINPWNRKEILLLGAINFPYFYVYNMDEKTYCQVQLKTKASTLAKDDDGTIIDEVCCNMNKYKNADKKERSEHNAVFNQCKAVLGNTIVSEKLQMKEDSSLGLFVFGAPYEMSTVLFDIDIDDADTKQENQSNDTSDNGSCHMHDKYYLKPLNHYFDKFQLCRSTSSVLNYKDWLFIVDNMEFHIFRWQFAQDNDNNNDDNDNDNETSIKTLKLVEKNTIYMSGKERCFHASFVVPKKYSSLISNDHGYDESNHDNTDNVKNTVTSNWTNDDEIIQIMLFGGLELVPFAESFTLFRINLTKVELLKQKMNSCDEKDFQTRQEIYIKYRYVEQIDNPIWFTRNINNAINGLITKQECFYSFAYHLVKQRYLIILGGSSQDDNLSCDSYKTILYFDLKYGEWYKCEKVLPFEIFRHSSVVYINDNNEFIIHIIGGLDQWETKQKIHWQLNVSDIIPNIGISWNIERLIWIAHLKNNYANDVTNSENKCYFAKFSKDLTVYFVRFLT